MFVSIVTNARPMKRQKLEVKEPVFKVEGLRTRRSKTSFESAMELKAKRAMTMVSCHLLFNVNYVDGL